MEYDMNYGAEGNMAQQFPSLTARVFPHQGQASNLLAYASVNIGGFFAVNDLRVMNGRNGPFVAMPSRKGQDGKYYDVCFPTTKEMRGAIQATVLAEYERAEVRQGNQQQYQESRPSIRDRMEANKGGSRDQKLVGRLTFANSDVLEFTDPVEYVKRLREEIDFISTTGMSHETLTDDPNTRKAVDDIVCGLFGEENPHPLEDYIRKPQRETQKDVR